MGKLIRIERIAIGISQAELAVLSGLSRVTIGNLESGKLHDLGMQKLGRICTVLGLDLALSSASAKQSDWLRVAAQTASTGYKAILAPDQLARMLLSGHVQAEYAPHMISLLQEAPKPVLYGAINYTSCDGALHERRCRKLY